jgi:hypothetical protein
MAAELQQAMQQQQQQQQPAERFAASSSSSSSSSSSDSSSCDQRQKQQQQQQQQQRQQQQCQPLSNSGQGLQLVLARLLIMLWIAVVTVAPQAIWIERVFEDAAVCSTVLPAVQLMLALLRTQATLQCSSSSSSSSTDDELGHQVRRSLGSAITLAGAIHSRPYEQRRLLQYPGVLQLLTASELQDLLLVATAYLVELVYTQQQGKVAVDAASVLRNLSNSSAAAQYTTTTTTSSSSTHTSAAGSNTRAEPHHKSVFVLLGLPAKDICGPLQLVGCTPGARSFLQSLLPTLDTRLEVTMSAAACCMRQRFLAAAAPSLVADSSSSSASILPLSVESTSTAAAATAQVGCRLRRRLRACL